MGYKVKARSPEGLIEYPLCEAHTALNMSRNFESAS